MSLKIRVSNESKVVLHHYVTQELKRRYHNRFIHCKGQIQGQYGLISEREPGYCIAISSLVTYSLFVTYD